MAPPPAKEPHPGERSRLVLWLAAAAGTVGLIALFAGFGGPAGPTAGLGRVLELVLSWTAIVPALYLLSAYGLGVVFDRVITGSPHRHALRMGLGLGLLLTLSHTAGVLGFLDATLVAEISLLPGLALLIVSRARERTSVRPSAWSLAWMPAIALLVVAASNPPGILWLSEGRGYDALSYHLQLPQDWLVLGRIAPVEHNVYSYLPGYVEAAFYHVGLLMGAAPPGAGEVRAWGLTAGEGDALIACQYLSVGIALVAVWMVASVASALLARRGFDDRIRTPVSILNGAFVLSTPWTIVTGSLAYNDLCVVALAGAGVLAATESTLSPARRGVLSGLLIGFACGAKPTALILAAPVAGVLLLGTLPPRRWVTAVVWGSLAGLLALAPWLVRNWVYSGNPVFPMAGGLFGASHWDQEQFARYAAAHTPDALAAGLRHMLSPGGGRGLLHWQWLAFFPASLAGSVIALVARSTRRTAALLMLALVIQLAAWLLLTHVQSRFLIPLALAAAPLFALGLAVIASRAWGALIAGGLAVTAQLLASGAIFAAETVSNQPLIAGPGAFTGELFRDLPPSRGLEDALSPQAFANRTLPPTARVYLLAEARPLYLAIPTVYNTTWDRWPLGEAIRRHPGDAAAWARDLRARGITHIYYNAAELARLRTSGDGGWSDPLVTPELVAAFLEQRSRPVRSWPEAGIFLVELIPPDGAAPP